MHNEATRAIGAGCLLFLLKCFAHEGQHNTAMFYSCTEVDKAVEILSNELIQILNELAPIKVFQVRSNYAPWLSAATKQWMKFRDETLQKAVQFQSQSDWMDYRFLRNKVNNLLQSDKRAWKMSKLRHVAVNTSSVWQFAKSWLGWKSGGPPTQLNVNGVNHMKLLK